MCKTLSWSIYLYVPLFLLLSTTLLYFSICDKHAHTIARSTLQFLTALSLLPVWKSSSQRKARPCTPRRQVLASFLLCLTLLIDALLRILTAMEVLFYNLDSVQFKYHYTVLASRLILSSSILLMLRRRNADACSKNPCLSALVSRAVYVQTISATLADCSDILGLLMTSSLSSAMFDIFAAIVAIFNALPLLHYTTRILMHAVPLKAVNTIASKRDAFSQLEGVHTCGDIHIWEEGEGIVVGTVSLVVSAHAHKTILLERIMQIFQGVVDDLTVQMETLNPEDKGLST